jgi:hypothetical protein
MSNPAYARIRRYQATPKGKAARARYRRSRKFLDGVSAYHSGPARIRRNAVARVRKAVLRGRLEKRPCELCGDPRSFAHHPFGYEGEMALAVWWLCRVHHDDLHYTMRAAAEQA